MAEAFDANGNAIAGASFEWSSSDGSVAAVDGTGLVRGVSEGAVTITATAGSASGIAQMTVENPERAALVALYEATDGTNWLNNENWLTDVALGEWYGVDTDRSGRVERLRLLRNGLSGAIPPELGNLANLVGLTLGENYLSGAIPPELGNLAIWCRCPSLGTSCRARFRSSWGTSPIWCGCTSLGTSCRGAIPAELGNLANLVSLGLSGNELSGAIPPELGNLANLVSLSLWENDLSGAIPATLLGLPLSNLLWATRHRLTGEWTSDLCAPGTSVFVEWLDGMEEWRGPFCNASDEEVLTSFYKLAAGAEWTESRGWLGGPALGGWHGVETDSLGRVTALGLSDNGLSGSLTGAIGNLDRMAGLRVDGNELGGRLPLSLSRLDLEVFHYDGTDLCEPGDARFRTWLERIVERRGTEVQCAALTDRDALVALYEATGGPNWTDKTNWLTDAPLAEWYGVTVDARRRVRNLLLWENDLSGAIPAELGNLANLETLFLDGNDLSGAIPAELGEPR